MAVFNPFISYAGRISIPLFHFGRLGPGPFAQLIPECVGNGRRVMVIRNDVRGDQYQQFGLAVVVCVGSEQLPGNGYIF